jgi:hypothetical protein
MKRVAKGVVTSKINNARLANNADELVAQLAEEADKVLVDFPGDITIGERREALHRLFVARLGWAMRDKLVAARHPDIGNDCESWLENAIGETLVRAYALGVLHSKDGAKAEVSGPVACCTDIEQPKMVQCLDWAGKPADLRPCDLAIELLHQVFRYCLPAWAETPSPLSNIRGRITQLEAGHSWLAGAIPIDPKTGERLLDGEVASTCKN